MLSVWKEVSWRKLQIPKTEDGRTNGHKLDINMFVKRKYYDRWVIYY